MTTQTAVEEQTAQIVTLKDNLDALLASVAGISARANTAASTAEQNLATTQQLSDQITGQMTTFENVLAGIDQRLTDTVARIDDVLILTPRAQPTGTVAEGTVYYDKTLKKARCWDGTAWQNCW